MENALCLSGAAAGAALSSLLVAAVRQRAPEKVDGGSSLAIDGALCASGAALGAAFVSLLVTAARQPGPGPALGARSLRADPAPGAGAGGTAEASRRAALAGTAAEVPKSDWRGWSMEEARKRSQADATRHRELVPAEVLAELQRGNARFWSGAATRPEKSAFERRALIMQQFPSVAILSCSDSRVPAEIVFDQGLGDMFVVRVAGNCLDTTTHASLQFAVQHLQVKVLLVMGHEACGAVKAAGLPDDQLEQQPAKLCQTLKMLKQGLDGNRLRCVHDQRAHDREAVVTNVKRQVEELMADPTVLNQVRAKKLIVAGAFYEISSGIVDFFDQRD